MSRTAIIFIAAAGLVIVALAVGVADLEADEATPQGPGETTAPHAPSPIQPVAQPSEGNEREPAGHGDCPLEAAAKASTPLKIGQLSAALSRAKVLHEDTDDIFVALDIETEDVLLDERPPLNLALVIDRSGSMRGDPMKQAKRAARGMVQRLGDIDRVAIVTYDTGAEVVVPSTKANHIGKRRLLSAIDGITARGMTNIHGGLVLGYEELTRGLSDGVISRLVHLSDGQANVGVTDTPSLVKLATEAANRGIRNTSVGLGVHYNEHLMEALADAGRGQYYYVRDGRALDEVFAGELQSIQATVAQDVELHLEPCPNARIEEVYGLRSKKEGSAVAVSLSDLAGGDRLRVVARLSRERSEGDGDVSQPIVNARLSYRDVRGREDQEAALSLGVTATPDEETAESSIDGDVMAQVIEVQGALALRTATESFERGDRPGASQQLAQEQRRLNQQAQRYNVQRAPAARRTSRAMDKFRALFSASADALAGEEARDASLEAQSTARSMERKRFDDFSEDGKDL